MKNNQGLSPIILTAVIAGSLILGSGGYYFAKSYYDKQDKPKVIIGNNCHESDNYFIITRPDLSGNAGDDLLIKYKTNKDQKNDCDYKVTEGDFELLNSRLVGASIVPSAQYFSNIKDNLLIVDEGTGTFRSFTIYDLVKKEKVFADSYSAGLFDLKDNILSYWHKTNDVPKE